MTLTRDERASLPLNPPQDYRKTERIHRRGLAAQRPAPGEVLPGSLYFSTDTGLLERSTGQAWESYAAPIASGVAAHHATHEPGGSDALTKLDGGIILPQTIVDASLSANVALRNVNNNFSADQVVNGNIQGQDVYALGVVSSYGAGFMELGRGTPIGYWQDVPFNAANFTAEGGGTWTVDATAVMVNRYTLSGRTMIWRMYVSWFQGTSVIAGNVTRLHLATPVPTPGNIPSPPSIVIDGSGDVSLACMMLDQVSDVIVYRRDQGPFTPGTVGVVATMIYEIQ
jgi:hypothetical protein